MMILLWILLLSIGLAEFRCLPSAERVFAAGGNVYDRMDYPYVVGLRFGDGSICTGSLIAPQIVLTAAHCTWQREASDILVFRGSLSPYNYDFRSISEIHQHDKYANEGYSADISLIKLITPFKNITHYADISGNPKEFENGTELHCKIIGFGRRENNTFGLDGYMADVRVKHGPNACAKPLIKSDVDELMNERWSEFLCLTPDKRMSCPGDSGGPLICNEFIYGICNFGYNYKSGPVECGSPDVQTTHLFLHKYLDWLSSERLKMNSGCLNSRPHRNKCKILLALVSLITAVYC